MSCWSGFKQHYQKLRLLFLLTLGRSLKFSSWFCRQVFYLPGDYYLIENYISPFIKGIIEKKKCSAEFPHLSECYIIRIFKNPSDIKGKMSVLYLIFNFLHLWKKHVVEKMKYCLVSFQSNCKSALWRVQLLQWRFYSVLNTSFLSSLDQDALSISCLHLFYLGTKTIYWNETLKYNIN